MESSPTVETRMLGSARKRKAPAVPGSGDGFPLDELHQDVLERVLAWLPPDSALRSGAVCRRWRAASKSPTFLAACAAVPAREPWFLMVGDGGDLSAPSTVFDSSVNGGWKRLRRPPQLGFAASPMPVASAGGLVCHRWPSGDLAVINPLTGACRRLPPASNAVRGRPLHAVAMYTTPSSYRIALILHEFSDYSIVEYDSATNAWSPEAELHWASPENDDDDASSLDAVGDAAVYFLSKAGDVVCSTMQKSVCKQFAAVVVAESGEPVAYFLSPTGSVVACCLVRRTVAELPRILPLHCEYSVDVVTVSGGRVLVVVLAEFLETASVRVWEFCAGERAWRQVAAMPPAMSHGFYGKKADVNCAGHGDTVLICVGGGCGRFLCELKEDRWAELPECGVDGESEEFSAGFAFEPRLEIGV